MRLIDADAMQAAIARIKAMKEATEMHKAVLDIFSKMIDETQTVEKAVVPVRCAECRDLKGGYCVGFGPNGFCSDGEEDRKGRRRC